MSPFICIERRDKSSLTAALGSVDINTRNSAGESLLHAAAGKHGSAEMAAEVVRRGIDVNLQNRNGATALHFAVEFRHKDVAAIILGAGGRFDVEDEHGNQPLWYAVRDPHRDLSMIELLLLHGADPNHRNQYGKTPLEAARARGIEPLVQLLTAVRRG